MAPIQDKWIIHSYFRANKKRPFSKKTGLSQKDYNDGTVSSVTRLSVVGPVALCRLIAQELPFSETATVKYNIWQLDMSLILSYFF